MSRNASILPNLAKSPKATKTMPDNQDPAQTTATEISIGGPHIFVQGPPSAKGQPGLWGKFQLPEGKRVENGDSFTVYECVFLELYREITLPRKPPRDALGRMDPEARAAWEVQIEQWGEDLQREDAETTFSGDSFITLVPIDANYRID